MAAKPLKLKTKALSPKQAESFARSNLELTLDPEMLARQVELLGKKVRRELTAKEAEELDMIGRLLKTLQDERGEAWEILNKASQ